MTNHKMFWNVITHLLPESRPSVLHHDDEGEDDDYASDYLPCIPLYFC